MKALLKFKSMKECTVTGKRVLVRVDINSPLDPVTKHITSDNRIVKTAPTVRWLAEQGAKVALIAHQGDTDDYQNLITLEEHATLLAKELDRPVRYIDDVCGPAAVQAIEALNEGDIVLLGNLRYLAEEISVFEKVVPLKPSEMTGCWLIRTLAPLFDLYVNDAFSAAHRSSPSMVAFQEVLPSAAGPLLFDEVEALTTILTASEHPSVFVLGGARIGDAFGMMQSVLENGTADRILTLGVTGQVFLLASGIELGEKTHAFLQGKSLLGFVDEARAFLKSYPNRILMPTDLAYADVHGTRVEIAVQTSMPNESYGDIGSKTIELYSREIAKAKTVFVNGPAGIYEKELFEKATREIWRAIAASDGYTVVGGGDSVSAASKYTNLDDWSYVCTAGGAMVRFMSGKTLPLIKAMEQASK
ncbi:MAG: phosphoglycerate kinase [Spirochaetales bacterium]|nr:phosphoglycerate kinase [Spirochaetales bacterium]